MLHHPTQVTWQHHHALHLQYPHTPACTCTTACMSRARETKAAAAAPAAGTRCCSSGLIRVDPSRYHAEKRVIGSVSGSECLLSVLPRFFLSLPLSLSLSLSLSPSSVRPTFLKANTASLSSDKDPPLSSIQLWSAATAGLPLAVHAGRARAPTMARFNLNFPHNE